MFAFQQANLRFAAFDQVHEALGAIAHDRVQTNGLETLAGVVAVAGVPQHIHVEVVRLAV